MKKSFAEILKVSPIFRMLSNKHYNNFSLSYKIAKASKMLEEQVTFYSEEERKIVETYALKDDDGNVKIVDGNRINFKDKDDAIKFNNEINKLQHTEIEVFDPIVIHLNDFRNGDFDLTPNDILALEPFVEFSDLDESENTGKA